MCEQNGITIDENVRLLGLEIGFKKIFFSNKGLNFILELQLIRFSGYPAANKKDEEAINIHNSMIFDFEISIWAEFYFYNYLINTLSFIKNIRE